jgi:G3E family GTPase
MKILLVGGFLGSGKTSFILQLAHYMVEKMGMKQIAILENEIGELSVDDKLLKGAGYEVRGLFSGCVCCTMAAELPATIQQIEKDLDPEWLIMEATGVAFPHFIRDNIHETIGMESRICCLADAKRWNKIVRALDHLLNDQLTGADIILVNKADLVDEAELEKVIEAVKEINGTAVVAATSANKDLPEGIFEQVLL